MKNIVRPFGLPTIPPVTATDDAVGVPKKFWYVGIVECRKEKKVAQQMESLGYESYLPLRTENHEWSRGRIRKVEINVLPAKIFLHVTERQRLDILRLKVGVLRCLVNQAGTPNAYGIRPVARISEKEMAQLRLMLDNSPSPVEFSEYHFTKGDRVRVISGPLKSLEGIVRHDTHGKPRIYITIEALGSANTEIDITAIEKIE